MKNITQLRDELTNRKKENTEKKATVSVRVTP